MESIVKWSRNSRPKIQLKSIFLGWSSKYPLTVNMGKNAVNIGQHYFHNEDLSEAIKGFPDFSFEL